MSDTQNTDLNEPQDLTDVTDLNEQAANAGDNAMDDWNQALQEQQAAEAKKAEAEAAAKQAAQEPATAAPAAVFKSLDAQKPQALGAGFDINMIRDIPVNLSVELGRARLAISELLQLSQGSVVELKNLAGEPMDIYINGFLIAQGEVVVVGDNYGVRLTDIVTPAERLSRLSKR